MRDMYKRSGKLLDDGVLIEGYVSKRKFYPDDYRCGFSYQIIHKRDIGKILFYNREKVEKKI